MTLAATSENSLGVVRLFANLPFVVASCVRLQLRPLPSAGVIAESFRNPMSSINDFHLGDVVRVAF